MKQTPLSKMWIHYSKNTDLNEVINNPNCTFLGGRSDQSFTAFYVWEKFFLAFGEPMRRFIEFGCDQGNTSVYFLLQCINNEAVYFGFDKRKTAYRSTAVKRLLDLDSRMTLGDGYKKTKMIRDMIQSSGMSVIFTDCIDKPWEFNTFAPMLKKGDIIAVHDWGRAIRSSWVQSTLQRIQPYRLLFEEERLSLNTLTKFFQKQ